MTVQSTFQDLFFEFVYYWDCPKCKTRNRAGVKSPLTQSAIRLCHICLSEYDVLLDMEGAQAKKKELIKKLGSEILSSLIPGY